MSLSSCLDSHNGTLDILKRMEGDTTQDLLMWDLRSCPSLGDQHPRVLKKPAEPASLIDGNCRSPGEMPDSGKKRSPSFPEEEKRILERFQAGIKEADGWAP